MVTRYGVKPAWLWRGTRMKPNEIRYRIAVSDGCFDPSEREGSGVVASRMLAEHREILCVRQRWWSRACLYP